MHLNPGTYYIDSQIWLDNGHWLYGDAGQRDSTWIVASGTFPVWGQGDSTMIRTTGAGNTHVEDISLHGNDRAVRGICCEGYIFTNARATRMSCDGAVMVRNSTVSSSDISYQAYYTNCGSATNSTGSGIYVENGGDPVGHGYNTIWANEVHHNQGMGIDVNSSYFGTIAWNNVHDNTGIAGIGIYEATGWNITQNIVNHWGTNFTSGAFHPYCSGGPVGDYSAALWLCQDGAGRSAVDNTIQTNTFVGPYGIKSIGGDEVVPYNVPRRNTYTGNVLSGSSFGCADDFAPGQWFSDDDYWYNNNCEGPANTPPAYF